MAHGALNAYGTVSHMGHVGQPGTRDGLWPMAGGLRDTERQGPRTRTRRSLRPRSTGARRWGHPRLSRWAPLEGGGPHEEGLGGMGEGGGGVALQPNPCFLLPPNPPPRAGGDKGTKGMNTRYAHKHVVPAGQARFVRSTGAAASQCVTPRGVRQFGGL